MKRFLAAFALLWTSSVFATGFDFRTSGTVTATYYDFRIPGGLPSLSASGHAVLLIDPACSCLKISINGAAYTGVNGGPGGSGVTSVFGRTGAVVANYADYLASQVQAVPFSTITGTDVQTQIQQVNARISAAAVTSVFGRTGVITATAGDYTATKVTNTPAGNVAATDVQAAINELDTEKVDKTVANTYTAQQIYQTTGLSVLVKPPSAPVANTKVVEARTNTDVSNFSIDAEGDVIAHDLTLNGALTASGVVYTTTNQTIAGRKTFSTATQAATGVVDQGTAAKAFGDSITLGTGLSAGQDWPAVTGAAKGWTVTNSAVSGTLLEDSGQIDSITAESPIETNQYLLLSGYNDMRTFGSGAGLSDYQETLYVALAHLATLQTKKLVPASVTLGGVWTTGAAFGGAYTDANAATATFTLQGPIVYVCSSRLSGTTGTFTITIDGTVRATVDASTSFPGTPNGRLYHPFLTRITGLHTGKHTVVVTKTAGSRIFFNWALSPSAATGQAGPEVWVGNCLRMTTTGYTLGGPTYNHGSDAIVRTYNAIIRDAVRELASDGLNVALVDASAAFDPDVSADLQGDAVHPTAAGAQKIANAFLSEADALATNRVRVRGTRAYIPIGDVPAQTGALRLPTQQAVVWRNAADTGDGASVTTNGSDQLVLSPTLADSNLATIATAGKVADTALSSNIPRKNTTNSFSAQQTITSGGLSVTSGGIALTGGQVASSTQFRSRATNSALQTISNITLTALTFDTNSFDVGSVHSTVTNNTRFTVPTGGAGVWLMNGQVAFAANSGGFRAVQIKKNGTTVIADQRSSVNSGTDFQYLNVTAIDSAADGDYYEIVVFQSSGGNLNTTAGSAATYGSAVKLY